MLWCFSCVVESRANSPVFLWLWKFFPAREMCGSGLIEDRVGDFGFGVEDGIFCGMGGINADVEMGAEAAGGEVAGHFYGIGAVTKVDLHFEIFTLAGCFPFEDAGDGDEAVFVYVPVFYPGVAENGADDKEGGEGEPVYFGEGVHWRENTDGSGKIKGAGDGQPPKCQDFLTISIMAESSSTAASLVPVKPVIRNRMLPFLSITNLLGMPWIPNASTTLLVAVTGSFLSIRT